jgi:hypothetical protein
MRGIHVYLGLATMSNPRYMPDPRALGSGVVLLKIKKKYYINKKNMNT